MLNLMTATDNLLWQIHDGAVSRQVARDRGGGGKFASNTPEFEIQG